MANTGEVMSIIPTDMDLSKLATANDTANVSITNVAPGAVGTATISGWIRIRIQGTDCYIPYWT